MKLNDPFGRLERRNQASYELMRDTMKNGGITTVEAAQDIISASKNRTLKFLAIVLAVLLIALAFKPQLWAFFVCMAMLILAWAVKSMRNGRQFVERYIDEEITGSNGI